MLGHQCEVKVSLEFGPAPNDGQGLRGVKMSVPAPCDQTLIWEVKLLVTGNSDAVLEVKAVQADRPPVKAVSVAACLRIQSVYFEHYSATICDGCLKSCKDGHCLNFNRFEEGFGNTAELAHLTQFHQDVPIFVPLTEFVQGRCVKAFNVKKATKTQVDLTISHFGLKQTLLSQPDLTGLSAGLEVSCNFFLELKFSFSVPCEFFSYVMTNKLEMFEVMWGIM